MIKKAIPFILILIVLAGLFGPTEKAQAEKEKWFFTTRTASTFDSEGYGRLHGPFASKTECEAQSPGGFLWRVITGSLVETTVERPCYMQGTPLQPIAPTADAFGCDFPFVTKMGCLAGFSYMLWSISASIAELGGKFLDFFVYYSTNSASYSNTFVEKGWAVVRDIANIFFIIALLYIAIKTVLNLEGSHSKKMIANIIIIALIINFSLFTTKVVIDATNILAKVFYNSIKPIDANGDPVIGAGGQKSISVGLISKYNPTDIIKIEPNYNAGQFTFVTILLLVITTYTAYMFFAVALLFVARVISLWMSMIFSPLAFISYTVPFDIPGFGYKKWWDDLLKAAFLAPLFVFFLYIIVMFADFLKDIGDLYPKSETDKMQKLMSVVIPFAILMALLMKAKKLAVEYSGDMGKAVMTAGKMLGGVALGTAALSGAMAGKRVIGGLGGGGLHLLGKGAEKIGLKGIGGGIRNLGDLAQRGSYDVRGIKVGGKGLASLTGMHVGEAQKGGWTAMKKEQEEKRTKRNDELVKRGTEGERKDVEDAQGKLHAVTLPVKLDLEKQEKIIEKLRNDLNDISKNGTPEAIDDAKKALQDAQKEKARIRGAEYKDPTTGAVVLTETTGGIADLEKKLQNAQKTLDAKSGKIAHAYADEVSGIISKTLNYVVRLGAYSPGAANEAARRIRSGAKSTPTEKAH